MKDIFNTTILCEECDKKTKKGMEIRLGHNLRFWQCPSCDKKWYHPLDLQAIENFQKIKQKQYKVKLRLVGNSYAVSIPREIITFQEEFQKQLNKMISLSLDEPEKLTLYFNRRLRL